MSHPYGLRDDEYAAIVALKRGEPGPPETSEAWDALLKMKLVWRDPLEGGLRLTPAGDRYPATVPDPDQPDEPVNSL